MTKKEEEKKDCIGFTLNYCDGGQDNEHIGFGGICSRKVMKYNVENRGWCSHEDNLCKQLLSKKISPEEFKEKWNRAETEAIAGTCNEGFALKLWYAESIPKDKGNNTWGSCRISRKDLVGHLCILTTIPLYKGEESRFILAIFKIKRIYDSDDNLISYVEADKEWKLEFRPYEVKLMNFWEIYQKIYPKIDPNSSQRWGQNSFRYFNADFSIECLERAKDVKLGTLEEDRAKKFLNQYKNFCKGES